MPGLPRESVFRAVLPRRRVVVFPWYRPVMVEVGFLALAVGSDKRSRAAERPPRECLLRSRTRASGDPRRKGFEMAKNIYVGRCLPHEVADVNVLRHLETFPPRV